MVAVGPDLTAPDNRTACPACGARLRAEATFCGQCYADFRPPPPVASAPLSMAEGAAYGTAAPDPLTAPLLDVVLPRAAVPAQAPAPSSTPAKATMPSGWPCSRCEALNDFAAMLCHVCSAPFLAQVAEETRVSLTLPVVGDLNRYGRGQRAAIALGALLIVLIPLALITLLTTKAPPPSTTTGTPTGNVQPTPGN
jgi:hypothetical protein